MVADIIFLRHNLLWHVAIVRTCHDFVLAELGYLDI